MCDKMAISAYILGIVEKGPLLGLRVGAEEMVDRRQFFSAHKQYVRVGLMRDETNRWNVFLVGLKYW